MAFQLYFLLSVYSLFLWFHFHVFFCFFGFILGRSWEVWGPEWFLFSFFFFIFYGFTFFFLLFGVCICVMHVNCIINGCYLMLNDVTILHHKREKNTNYFLLIPLLQHTHHYTVLYRFRQSYITLEWTCHNSIVTAIDGNPTITSKIFRGIILDDKKKSFLFAHRNIIIAESFWIALQHTFRLVRMYLNVECGRF